MNQPPRIPCDTLRDAIPLYLDRELGPAETLTIEAHIEQCPRCHAEAEKLESLSALLKAWDADSNQHVPPHSRIQNVVLSRVAAQSARRRGEDRMVRFLRYATAASVVIGLGVALVLGLRDRQAASRSEASASRTTVERPRVPNAPLADLGDPSPLASTAQATERRRGRLVAESAPLAGTPDAMEASQYVSIASAARPPTLFLVDLQIRAEQKLRFDAHARGPEERGVWLPIGNDGARRLTTLGALAYLERSGHIDRWLHPPRRSVEQATQTTPETARARRTGMTISDMLGPLTTQRFAQAQPERVLAHTRGIPRPPSGGLPNLASGDSPAAVLDPLQAQRAGQLRFRESGTSSELVVAFVKDTKHPIFLPAGQILTGGEVDRVVATPVWLPATGSNGARFQVACRVVEQRAAPRDQDDPKLTPWIAGPTIRALIARPDFRAERLRAVIEEQVSRRGAFASEEWSLVDLYPKQTQFITQWKAAFQRGDFAGFVVTDPQDRLLGIEVARLPGTAGSLLLARLYVGYQLEAFQREMLGGAVSVPGAPLKEALQHFARSDASFWAPDAAGLEDVRISHLDDAAGGVFFQAVEIGRSPLVVSGIAGDMPAVRDD